jgi:hypothetical protein
MTALEEQALVSRYQARCLECGRLVTSLNEGSGPEEGHADDCSWTIADELEARDLAEEGTRR